MIAPVAIAFTEVQTFLNLFRFLLKVVVLNWLARLVLLKNSTDQVRQELILHSWEEREY